MDALFDSFASRTDATAGFTCDPTIATTTQEKEGYPMTRESVIAELRHRAWQERAAASVRPSKPRTAAAERAAIALENLANDIEGGRVLPE